MGVVWWVRTAGRSWWRKGNQPVRETCFLINCCINGIPCRVSLHSCAQLIQGVDGFVVDARRGKLDTDTRWSCLSRRQALLYPVCDSAADMFKASAQHHKFSETLAREHASTPIDVCR